MRSLDGPGAKLLIYPMRIHAVSIQSGSNGNCIFIRAGEVRLLLDAGISGRQAEQRLAGIGEDIRRIDALVISHDHSDHIKSAGVFQRKYGMPIYATRATLDVPGAGLGKLSDVRTFRRGETITFGDVSVETVPTPHDAADGSVFVISYAGRRLGVLTDLGHVFKGLGDMIAGLDAVFLESNYDPRMLDDGPYPDFLKHRIRSPHGHISNLESARLLNERGGALKWACLSHLSESNNTPALALKTHREVIGRRDIQLHVASRYECSQVLGI